MGGASALVSAWLVGPRLGRWQLTEAPPMGSPTNALIGLYMLWWGWLAFNAGSTFGVNISASKSSIRRYVITEKAPTRAFSWLKAATTAFTLKTQC